MEVHRILSYSSVQTLHNMKVAISLLFQFISLGKSTENTVMFFYIDFLDMKEYIFYNTFISWIPSSDEFRAE